MEYDPSSRAAVLMADAEPPPHKRMRADPHVESPPPDPRVTLPPPDPRVAPPAPLLTTTTTLPPSQVNQNGGDDDDESTHTAKTVLERLVNTRNESIALAEQRKKELEAWYSYAMTLQERVTELEKMKERVEELEKMQDTYTTALARVLKAAQSGLDAVVSTKDGESKGGDHSPPEKKPSPPEKKPPPVKLQPEQAFPLQLQQPKQPSPPSYKGHLPTKGHTVEIVGVSYNIPTKVLVDFVAQRCSGFVRLGRYQTNMNQNNSRGAQISKFYAEFENVASANLAVRTLNAVQSPSFANGQAIISTNQMLQVGVCDDQTHDIGVLSKPIKWTNRNGQVQVYMMNPPPPPAMMTPSMMMMGSMNYPPPLRR